MPQYDPQRDAFFLNGEWVQAPALRAGVARWRNQRPHSPQQVAATAAAARAARGRAKPADGPAVGPGAGIVDCSGRWFAREYDY